MILRLIKKILKIKSPSEQYHPNTSIDADEILEKYDGIKTIQEQLDEIDNTLCTEYELNH